jgi:hypothetical protein
MISASVAAVPNTHSDTVCVPGGAPAATSCRSKSASGPIAASSCEFPTKTTGGGPGRGP